MEDVANVIIMICRSNSSPLLLCSLFQVYYTLGTCNIASGFSGLFGFTLSHGELAGGALWMSLDPPRHSTHVCGEPDMLQLPQDGLA
eukprot:364942-Chlamydomonas_euryale.AAC.17